MAAVQSSAEVVRYLEAHEKKEILRFVVVGSVDDGKSTLIGRLLHDSNGLYEDQLRAVKRASQMAGTDIDFSLFTDGLIAEREQGITIDVAYRYFATSKRKLIIADTPGHVQYTRNMATGASTANAAVILIDARLGVQKQSRRHAYIASLLGIPHLVACVNKMDAVGWDAATYDAIVREFSAFAEKLGFARLDFVPISALKGDNVVHASERAPFYDGPTLLELLETMPIDEDRDLRDFRFPVQMVLRPNLDYRGYAGQVASGVVRRGDTVMVLPSRKTSRVVAIDRADERADEAFAPMSVTLRLADEIDVSRGDMLVHPARAPRVEQRFDAMVVWMHERPLDRGKSYLLKHTTQTVRAEIEAVAHGVDLETLNDVAIERVGLNDIARVTVRAHRPLFVDAYRDNRSTGAFILIDSLTNDTVAAGMILDAKAIRQPVALDFERTQVSDAERRERLGHAGAAVVVSGEGARAAAFAVERALFDRGCVAAVVASDAAGACVAAGIVAVVVAGDVAGAVRVDAAAKDPGADAVRALEALGAIGDERR